MSTTKVSSSVLSCPSLQLVPLAFVAALACAVGCAGIDSDAADPGGDRGGGGKADQTGSCADESGADFCGEQSPDGCWCDSLCQQYGDCCSDHYAVCVCEPAQCQADDCGQLDDGCGGTIDCGDCGCPDGEVGDDLLLIDGSAGIMDAHVSDGVLAVLYTRGGGNTVGAKLAVAQVNQLGAGMVERDLHGYALDVASGGGLTATPAGFAFTYNLRDYTYGTSMCVFQTVDDTGQTIDSRINLRNGKGCGWAALTWNGSRYTLLLDSDPLVAADVGTNSLLIGGSGRPLGESSGIVRDLVNSSGQLIAAYSLYVGRDDHDNSNIEIFAQTVNGSSAGAPVQVSSRNGISRRPQLAAGPGGTALAWFDMEPADDGGEHRLEFTVLDENAVPRFRPVSLASDSYDRPPALAGGTSSYGVAWIAHQDRLRFVEVDEDGNALTAPILIASDASSARLVHDGDAYYLIWSAGDGTGIYATRICGQ